MGRMGTGEEIASAAVMVLANGFMNGQTVNLNGGAYMSS
jgi:3-oxoacyl-[acyl-carrier protein] reductase